MRIINVVITLDRNQLLSGNVKVSDPGLCNNSGHLIKDRIVVTSLLNLSRPSAVKREVLYQNLCEINVSEFKKDSRAFSSFD